MKCLNPIRLMLTLVCLLSLMSGISRAALKAVGPLNPVTSLPAYYMDTKDLPLQICLDQNGMCPLGPPFDPAFPPFEPITTTGPVDATNFPDESFYYFAAASIPIEGGADTAGLEFVLEAAFLSGVIPNTAVTFLRTDLQKMSGLPPNTHYRATHPYGTFDFETDALGFTVNGGGAIRFEDQAGVPADYFPAFMQAAPITNMGPFLTPANGILPTALVNGETHTYIGDAATPVTVVGSMIPDDNHPSGFLNYFRIDRLDGPAGNPVPGASWETDLFKLGGRVYTDQIPSPMTIKRTTYASDGANGQVDLFVTALPSAALTVNGTGIATTILTQNVPNSGKFYAHLPFVGPLPSNVVVENSLDIPPIPYLLIPVDEVIISQAVYNPDTNNLTIKASTRDTTIPAATLTAPAFAVVGNPSANTLVAGTLVVNLSATISPLNVQVVSSHGGVATAKVRVDDGSTAAPLTTGGINR